MTDTLNEKALEKAREAYSEASGRNCAAAGLDAAIRAFLSSLPAGYYAGLVEEIHEAEWWQRGDENGTTVVSVAPERLAEAYVAQSAAIAALVAGRDAWQREAKSLSDKYSDAYVRSRSAEAQLKAMDEALEPFAEAADDLDDNAQDQHDIWEHPASMNITIGNLRAARRARAVKGGE